ncbi:helix-turn-helix transcriptional regulator [Pseudothauera hydrothermalis]|uniref:helix-turn-helix transcriptional regulator n=1 Tax=Pseudothauera hydrothermalis TaxID=2184083 RepID=UPI000E095AE3|nr:WYL domain-containing protein [Pseudothauera hydrothermalis]
MSRTERFYRIDQMLAERRVVPLKSFLEALEISRATFKRDLEYMRERLNAPIVWDREGGGYRFETTAAAGPAYELPGLWFSAGELYALLAAQKLLAEVEPGILSAHIAPLQSRLAAMLEAAGQPAQEVARRVRILCVARRPVEPKGFSDIALALLQRQRIEIDAWNRARDEVNTRVVSPQRLTHYRDNWYLDAWCHWRKDLRSFALDTIRRVKVLPQKAREIADKTLDAHYASAYGIFAGRPKGRAVLRFSPERARWVRAETWHPEQSAEDLPDGGLRLTLPYADERELLMDILRHGRHVVVEAPASLKKRVAEEIAAMAEHYGAV